MLRGGHGFAFAHENAVQRLPVFVDYSVSSGFGTNVAAMQSHHKLYLHRTAKNGFQEQYAQFVPHYTLLYRYLSIPSRSLYLFLYSLEQESLYSPKICVDINSV